MTDSEHARAIQAFGYTEREAAFLALVALHSGYFLRRQFLYFIERESGQIVYNFIEKTAETLKHTITLPGSLDIFQVVFKPIYSVLGEPNNRNRRRHDPTIIRQRLMALDYVLQNRNRRFFPTESDKVSYFTRALKLPESILPQRDYSSPATGETTTRFFVDKNPVFIPVNDVPVVHFVFTDPGYAYIDAFETYVSQYSPLWRELGRFNLIYVFWGDDRESQAAKARRFFERRIQQSVPKAESIPEGLLDHFAERKRWEDGLRSDFTQTDIARYRKRRKQFGEPRFQLLYERWKSGGDAAFRPTADPKNRIRTEFIPYQLQFRYDLTQTYPRGRFSEETACV